MVTLWIAGILLVVPPGDATAPQPLVPPRAGAALRDATHETLRRWARPAQQDAHAAAREFLALYEELQRDEQLPRAEREQLRAKVRGRLAQLSQQIGKRVALETRPAKSNRPKSVDRDAKPDDVLAQRGGLGRPGIGGPGFGGPGFGAPGGVGVPMFGGPVSAVADNGQQLVDLIQRTISPGTWDVNGGPGSIYYWAPGRAIVVRAPGEIHDQIGGVLQQLQRLGN